MRQLGVQRHQFGGIVFYQIIQAVTLSQRGRFFLTVPPNAAVKDFWCFVVYSDVPDSFEKHGGVHEQLMPIERQWHFIHTDNHLIRAMPRQEFGSVIGA